MESTTTEFIYEVNMNMKNYLTSAESPNGIVHELLDDNSLSGNNQITFEIPSNLDLERIKSLDNFTNLLHRIGGTLAGATNADLIGSTNQNDIGAKIITNDGHNINSEQISGSVVLNLADIKTNGDNLANFFGNTDIHLLINYLWIGVVTSLIILSIIFIIFSCYFYRKFKEWKKCNKDIRSQMSNDLYPNGGLTCGLSSEDNYYQMESPPCYTIATGLPTYDEALRHTANSAAPPPPPSPLLPSSLTTTITTTPPSASHYTFEQKFLNTPMMDPSSINMTSTSSAFLSDSGNYILCNNYIKPNWNINGTYFPSSTLSADFNKDLDNYTTQSIAIQINDESELQIRQQEESHEKIFNYENSNICNINNNNNNNNQQDSDDDEDDDDDDDNNNCHEIVVIS